MIKEYENILRTVICQVLGDKDDAEFRVTSDRLSIWKKRRDEEKKIQLETRLIYYSDFYDLYTVINKNWLYFKPIFDDKKRFEIFFSEAARYRNTLAHGRELLSYQISLLSGIIGDLKYKIMCYHSKNMNPDDYFLKILKVTDSLGSIWEYGMKPIIHTRKTLRVDDEIEYIIDAFDPKGRKMAYSINLEGKEINYKSNKLTLKITSGMVSKITSIILTVRTSKTEYKNKDSVNFLYSVIP